MNNLVQNLREIKHIALFLPRNVVGDPLENLHNVEVLLQGNVTIVASLDTNKVSVPTVVENRPAVLPGKR